ncbi:MAG: hypothetical protein ACO3JL_01815 [Myxococcota bacterium]
MSHKLRTHDLPSFQSQELRRPAIAQRAGVEVHDVTLADDGALLFRASGPGLPGGIYKERADGSPELLVGDAGAVVRAPAMRHRVLLLTRRRTGFSPPEEVVCVREGAPAICIAGQTYALSGDGRVALIADVRSGVLTHVELETMRVREVARLPLGHDPARPPLLCVDATGTEAILMTTSHAGRSLVGLSLEVGEEMVLAGPEPQATWMSGAFVPGDRGVVTVSCLAGERPCTMVSLIGADGSSRLLLRAPALSPAAVPVVTDDGLCLLPLCLAAPALNSAGTAELVAVSLDGKAPVTLTRDGNGEGAPLLRDDGVVCLAQNDQVACFTRSH